MKTKILKQSVFYIIVFELLFACEKKEDPNEMNQVRYGTSFGFCLGYCKKDLTLQSGSETFWASGWTDTIVPRKCTEPLNNSTWDSLKTGLEIPSFFNLPETIG
jgi:hypothetical protein